MDPRAGADFSRTWALVPIRGLESAKTRLGGDLDAEERRDLVTELLHRTLRAAGRATHIAGTIVVTTDPEAARIARDHRAVGLVERAPGLNAAISAARSVAIARGATAVLILPADLPAVSSEALDALVDAAEAGRASGSGIAALVTDQHGSGTNALLLSPPLVIDPAFGVASRDLHRLAAEAAGATFLELDGPLALDVDTPEDLAAAEASMRSVRG